ncbi:hypothetical protein GGTG_00623 [Gaeumannomyces tritici R3-111a-1]|uniref:Uncharacterized protein n=1 Tax=Gaeumannomyces tritici (strain R3-111a-1) TaxID=644352 RepID=J3NH85_GAET3|nr:hypothetical protein GGTG_00623 [Gaeumannomyces tritici R3-111a-1]EJT80628.1 hypothetical protein GGTG_00623 [Gaeumannomyces tritici R3-111a-1]
MDTSARSIGVEAGLSDVAVTDTADGSTQRGGRPSGDSAAEPSPMSKTRSLSDGGGTPATKLTPSPLTIDAARRTSKDDSAIRSPAIPALPVTPSRAGFAHRGSSGLAQSLRLPHQGAGMAGAAAATAAAATAGQSSPAKPAPLSPKLDHSHIYASPSSALPRRSRGLDFSRAATSLHHSTLAEQSSPDSSPTIGGRGAMNIPGGGGGARRHGDFGPAETTTSLWSMMGNHEKMHISSSVGSSANHMLGSDSSSSSDGDDLMDEDTDEPYITTPQIQKTTPHPGLGGPPPWAPAGSPAFNSLLSFQQRQRPRKQHKKRLRGPIGLGFSSIVGGGALTASKSPPSSLGAREPSNQHPRRESISWAANQLNISGNESDDGMRPPIMESVESVLGTPSRDGQTEAVRRVVTRRGNLMPKTKAFARMRAALAEEGTPVDSEVRREAEVVRQVRESDVDHHRPLPSTETVAVLSSPNLGTLEVDDAALADDAMMVDSSALQGGGGGLSSSYKLRALRNLRGGRAVWDTFSDTSSTGAGVTTPPPPPPPPSLLPRGSSSAMTVGSNTDDMSMDSPSTASGGIFPMSLNTRSSSGGDTPQQQQQQLQQQQAGGVGTAAATAAAAAAAAVPSAAEITRRINSKRRRDDDLDPVSFKRRAVSPGVSAHGSPVMQSPLQRDMVPWGSRPGSNGHDRPGSGAPSESGGSQSGGGRGGGGGGKGRVGYQGMVDTNDGITKLSID